MQNNQSGLKTLAFDLQKTIFIGFKQNSRSLGSSLASALRLLHAQPQRPPQASVKVSEGGEIRWREQADGAFNSCILPHLFTNDLH